MTNAYNKSQFAITRDMLREYLQFTDALSYAEWSEAPDADKAALLFLQFYDQIYLAWGNIKYRNTYEDSAVSEAMRMCLYLCGLSVGHGKAADVKISAKTYNPGYMYMAMYRAFTSLNCSRGESRSTYQPKNSRIAVYYQYQTIGTTEVDLLQDVPAYDNPETELDRQEFWRIVDSQGKDASAIARRVVTRKYLNYDYVDTDGGPMTTNSVEMPVNRMRALNRKKKRVFDNLCKVLQDYR